MHLNPGFMWSYFNENPILYDLRKRIKAFLPPVKSFRFGLNSSIHFRGSILWNNLPSSIKNSQTINEFKVKLKNLENIHRTCGACCGVVLFFNLFKNFKLFCYAHFPSIYLFTVKF